MKKKKTYRPSYRMGGRSYKDKKMKSGDDNYFNLASFLEVIGDPLGNLLSAEILEGKLEDLQGEISLTAPGGILETGMTAFGDYTTTPTGASQALQDLPGDIPGMLKPIKPTSTEFVEDRTDMQERLAGTGVQALSRTGRTGGLKGVLDAADTGALKTQQVGAQIEQKDKALQSKQDMTALQQIVGATTAGSAQDTQAGIAQFQGQAGVFGDLTEAYGTVQGDILEAQVNLFGQQAEAYGDVVSGLMTAAADVLTPLSEEGSKVPKMEEGANMKNYEEGGDSDMVKAGEPDISPGKFSHKENPIDLVQKRPSGKDEKIGEMTGGEIIMPPDDVEEFESLIANNDAKGVFNKLKGLFVKYEQKAKEHKEKMMGKESMKAKKGSRVYKPKSKMTY
jgi:hypothetical protein